MTAVSTAAPPPRRPDARARHAAYLHFAALAIACVLIPAASWRDGSGWLAWTMYARSATYRVGAIAWIDAGQKRRLSPTEIGVRGSPELVTFLSGSEHWRHAPVGPTLRRHLDEIAALGCEAAQNAQRVEVTLEERRSLDAVVEINRATATCPRR